MPLTGVKVARCFGKCLGFGGRVLLVFVLNECQTAFVYGDAEQMTFRVVETQVKACGAVELERKANDLSRSL